jgi:hypothetical protein
MVSTGSAFGGRPMMDALKSAQRHGIRVLRLLGIILLFAVVGPPVGVVLFLMAYSPASFLYLHYLDTTAFLLFGAYFFAGIPAAMAGLIVGIKHVYFAGTGWRFALGAGLLVGLAFAMLVVFEEVPPGRAPWFFGGLLCAAATLSTLACWKVVTSWFVEREVNA